MNRRGFLASILSAGVAPYVVTTAGVLMPVRGRVLKPFTGGLPLLGVNSSAPEDNVLTACVWHFELDLRRPKIGFNDGSWAIL